MKIGLTTARFKFFNVNTEHSTNQPTIPQRLFKQVSINKTMINNILDQLNLSYTREITIPEEGRIAINICVKTHEKGDVMLRFYPKGCQDTKLESGCVDFEVAALHYLSSNGVNVPAPLLFADGKVILDIEGIKIFAYECLPGKCLQASDLSVSIAKECGELLKNCVAISEKYIPEVQQILPEGDLDYIKKIYNLLLERFPQIQGNDSLKEMFEVVNEFSLNSQLMSTPKGIVHSDFFFENILRNSDKLTILDFGDAYYGHVIMDIVIGSMEFCVKKDRSWDLEMFQAFLEPHTEWLKKHRITFDFFYHLLLANCLRFAIYTIPSTLEEKEALSTNPYIFRFNELKKTKLRSSLEATFKPELRPTCRGKLGLNL